MGTLQVGGTTLGVKNSGTGKVDLSNVGAVTLTDSAVVPASVGASLVLLDTTTISTGVGHVTYDNTFITTTYNYYKIVIQGFESNADNFDLNAEFSNDNGSSGPTVKSVMNWIKINGASEGWTHDMSNFVIWSDADGAEATGTGCSAVLEVILPPDEDSIDLYAASWACVKNGDNNYYGYVTRGIATASLSTSARINYIKLNSINANINQGKVSLYGYKL